nr:glutamic acid-rich protein-like [Tanacetum cinerariifolium]
DAEGVVCLPNEEISAGLALMGYEKPSTKLTFYKAFFSGQWKFLIHTILQSLSAKRTSWNEFSTAMASAVICLSKGQKFNFSKYIFDSLVHNVDSSSKFYMVGKGFSGVETPLSEGMLADRQSVEEDLVAEQVQVDVPVAAADAENVAEDVSHVLDTCSALIRRVKHLERDNVAQKLEIVKLKVRVKKLEQSNKVKSLKFKHLRKVGASRRVESSDDMEDVFNQGRMINDMDKDEGIELVKDAEVLSMQEDDSEVQDVVEVVTTAKLITDVVTAVTSQVSAASATIPAAKPSIPTAAPTVVAAYTRRKRVIIRDPEEEVSLKTPAETPGLKDKGKGILVKSPKPMKKKDQIELDAEYARKLHEEINKDDAEFNKDIDWDAAIDHVNQQSSKNPQYIKRYHEMKKKPQTESEARKNMMIYLKNIAGYKMDFFKGMPYADICPIFQARFDEDITKRRKLNEEAQEAEALKKQLEIVNDEDDDVFTEATTLGRKVPLVDYEIVMINNKPRYPLSKFTLEQLVNVARLQVEKESEMSLELLRFTRQQLQEYQQG